MGLLDSIIGSLGQGQGGGGGLNPQLIQIVLSMLASDGQGGGLGGLIAQFQRGGMGAQMDSWISTGQNMPVSGDELGQVLGPDLIGNIAGQLGVSQGDAAGQLSQILPQLIDRLTPHGRVPDGGLGNLGDLLGMLGQR